MNTLAIILLYALIDRFAGGGWPWLDSKLPGRAAFWGALLCGSVGYLLFGPFGATVALPWLIWRTIPWSIFGGGMAPQDAPGVAENFLRQLLSMPLVMLAAYFTSKNLLVAFVASVVFAFSATVLAAWLGQQVKAHVAAGTPLGNENTVVELMRGALFGMAVAATALLS